MQGQSYGLPTVDGTVKNALPLPVIKGHVETFLACAAAHPELTFYVTEVGCGLALDKVSPAQRLAWAEQIAGFFVGALHLSNVVLPVRFYAYLVPTYSPLLADPEVIAEIGGIQVIDRCGDCVLHWLNGARPDYLVSGVEADARKLIEDNLFKDLCGEGVDGDTAAGLSSVCW